MHHDQNFICWVFHPALISGGEYDHFAQTFPTQFIGGIPINQVESFKYLGVIISSDLSWSTHINSTCTKGRKQLGFLYRNFYQANHDSIAYLYKATVLPILDYCCCMWDPYQSTHTAKFEKVQVCCQTYYWSLLDIGVGATGALGAFAPPQVS